VISLTGDLLLQDNVNVIYLDQNIAIGLAEERREFAATRAELLRLVDANQAVFPYSEIHLAESAGMRPDSQQQFGEFWDRISRGYSFLPGKTIRSEQFKDVFHGRKIRFCAHRFVIKDRGRFVDKIDWADPKSAAERSERLREVVAYWSSLSLSQIDGRIRIAEGRTISRMVVATLNKMLKRETPTLGELFSEHHTIASDLAWEIRDRDGDDPDPLFKAIAFMRDHFLEVPAIAIETTGLESLAEQYAIDQARKREVAKSQLDHDSNDLAALSNFVPYCDAAISDGNAVAIIRRAYKKLRRPPPKLFVQREIGKFVEFLQGLPPPEPEPDARTEITRTAGRSLVLIPRRREELVLRERFPDLDDIHREILPFGGLKVWTRKDTEWPVMVAALERFHADVEVGQGEATIFGGDDQRELLFDVRLPFGMFELAEADISAALH
jgi:hypothetical protein